MRVAVASGEGNSISAHFGRSAFFIVFEVEKGQILRKEIRPNTFTAHAKGQCKDRHQADLPHGHGPIVEALRDCSAVLCYGMGSRAAEELARNAIQPFIVDVRCTPEAAVGRYLEGKLLSAQQAFCRWQEP